MNLISKELLHNVIALNTKLIAGEIGHPARLALYLEQMASEAWSEAEELGAATWEDAEDLPPSLKF